MSVHLSNNTRIVHKNRSFHKKGVPEDFSLLYPVRAIIPRFIKDNVEISLHYQKIKLKVVVPLYVETNYLQEIFHEAIYKFQGCFQPHKAIRETAKVIGFESIDKDILLDYRITIGNGILDRAIDFKCLLYRGYKKIKPLQKYKIIKCLAIGGFSKVYLVRSLCDGKFYALKAISKKFLKENDKQNVIQNQKSICSKLCHPFIVQMKHCFESNNFLCFVFQYCPGGQLFYYLKSVKRIPQEKAKFYFIQILYGLQYLHQQGIIYRDLKPENLLINVDGHIKIADFGLSKENMTHKMRTYSFCGSAQYMPPQMILRSGHCFGVDYYTLGALLYQLVTGLPPFYCQNQQKLKDSILNEQITFPQNIELSQDLKKLLKGLLHKNQKLRLGSLKGIKELLFHPWIGKINTEQVLNKSLKPPYVPDVNEFNFDQNQLGDDEQEFTSQLLLDSRSQFQQNIEMYQDFQFQSKFDLPPNQLALLNQLAVQQGLQIHKSMQKTNSVITLKQSSSIKTLKPSNKHILNRDFSSPYLSSIYKKQRLTHLPSQEKSENNICKLISKSRPKKRILPKFINTFIPESFQSRIKRKNFRKVF